METASGCPNAGVNSRGSHLRFTPVANMSCQSLIWVRLVQFHDPAGKQLLCHMRFEFPEQEEL